MWGLNFASHPPSLRELLKDVLHKKKEYKPKERNPRVGEIECVKEPNSHFPLWEVRRQNES